MASFHVESFYQVNGKDYLPGEFTYSPAFGYLFLTIIILCFNLVFYLLECTGFIFMGSSK